jgi:hypothetical protein
MLSGVSYGIYSNYYNIAINGLSSYSEIHFLTIKNNDYWKDDGVREVTDLQFRQRVESELIHRYKNDYKGKLIVY